MSDDSAEQNPAQDSPQGEKTFTQTQLDSILAKERRETEALREKAEQFDALTESAKSAEEREADWRAKAEAAADELAWRDVLLLRQEVAAKKELDPRLWSRIQGETREEIEADIGELQGFSTPSFRKPSPAGLRSGASSDQQATAKQRAAEALRGVRER